MRLPSGNIWRLSAYTCAAGLALGLLCYGVVRFVDRTFTPGPELTVLLALGIGLLFGLSLFIACRLALRLAVYDLRHAAAEITGRPAERFSYTPLADELEVLRATLTNALASTESRGQPPLAFASDPAPDLTQRFSTTIAQLAQEIPLRGAVLLLHDTEGDMFAPALSWNMPLLNVDVVLPADEGAARRVLREQHEVVLSGAEARYVLPSLGLTNLPPDSDPPTILCLALLVADAPVGLLFLIHANDEPHWNTPWRELARVAANQLALLAQEALLLRDLARERARFDTLAHLAIELPQHPQVAVVLEHSLQAVAEATQSAHGTLLLLDKNEEVQYRIALTQGTLAPLQLVARSVLRNGLAGWALRERRATLINDTQRDSRWLPIPGLGDMRSALAVPLCYETRVLGVLTLAHEQPGHYSPRSLTLASALIAQVTHVLAYAQLIENPDMPSESMPDGSGDDGIHALSATIQEASSDAQMLATPRTTQAVVLVMQLRHFAAASEQLPSTVLLEDILSPYFKACSNVVAQHQGYLDRCDTTQVVAIFGLSQPIDEALVNALEVAQLLRKTLQCLRADWRSRFHCDLPAGIGIALDTVTVGQVAAQHTHVVAGVALNQAQRLQELARAGEVICNAAVDTVLRQTQPDSILLSLLQPLQPLPNRFGDEQLYRLLKQEDRVYDSHRA